MHNNLLLLILFIFSTNSYSGDLLEQLEAKIHILLNTNPKQVNTSVLSHHLISDLSKTCEKAYHSESMKDTLLDFILIKNNYLTLNQVNFNQNMQLIKTKPKEIQNEEGFNVGLISQYYSRKLEWASAENKIKICNGLSNMIINEKFSYEMLFHELELNELFAMTH